jgi:periplasmic divalent cation tolerance protein
MSNRNNAVVILVTAPDAEVAGSIGWTLVDERLAACVNIAPNLRSIYRWRGEVQDDPEVLMLIKARRDDLDAVVARVEKLHPNRVPEVIALEIVAGLETYLDWIQAETERDG